MSRWTPERLRGFHEDVVRSLARLPDDHPLAAIGKADWSVVDEIEHPPPSRPRGVVVVALCVFAALALGIAVAVVVTR